MTPDGVEMSEKKLEPIFFDSGYKGENVRPVETTYREEIHFLNKTCVFYQVAISGVIVSGTGSVLATAALHQVSFIVLCRQYSAGIIYFDCYLMAGVQKGFGILGNQRC